MAIPRGKKVKHLVVDAVGFLKNAELQTIGEHIYSIQEVVNEIKDKATKQRLQVLPYDLTFREPSQDAISFVTSFSKKTGDYCSLSATDIKVLALTYQLEKEFGGSDHLRTEPQAKPTFVATKKPLENPKEIPGFYLPPNKKSSETTTDETSVVRDEPKKEGVGNLPEVVSEESDESENDESSWITPENVREHMGDLSLDSTTIDHTTVACLTTDFAMQNVLMHLNSHVVSLDGMIIRQMKTFILRCHACFKTTSVMTKMFCPHCGNKTLKRVAVSVNENGEQVVQVSFRRPINIRGTKYSLPMPKGGKHAEPILLSEDQMIPHQKLSNMARAKLNALDTDYIAGNSPFALNDVYSKSANLGVRRGHNSNRKNPNEVRRKTGRKK